MRRSKVAFQMHRNHTVERRLFHREAHGITDEASVVHQDVQITKLGDGPLNQCLGSRPVTHTSTLRDRSPTIGNNRRSDNICRLTKIIDHDRSAFGSQQLGMATTDTLTCSGNYGDFAS